MKKVAVIFNGGTISMKIDPNLNAAVPTLSGAEIMSFVTGIDKIAEVDSFNFSSNPGPHMTPEIMVELAKMIRGLLASYDGVVVTHGTDSLEETAYLIDLIVETQKPIVFTGSMRSGSELGYDGPSNLAESITAAVSEETLGRGVLVCLNGELNSASDVTKSNSMALNAFTTPLFGPVGIVDNHKVIYYRDNERHESYEIDKIESRVGLIKTCTGMTSDIIDFFIERGDKGIVIEGMGRGNIPPLMVDGVKRAIEKNIPVVIVSRCYEGRALDSYGYLGGGKSLTKLGAILGDTLNGQKARIKLMVALSVTNNMDEIKKYFQKDFYTLTSEA